MGGSRVTMPVGGERLRCLALAYAPPLAALVLLVLGVAAWLGRWSAYETEIAARRDLLAKYTEIAAQSGSLEKELKAIAAQIKSSNYYYSDDKPALAGADIQQRVKDMVERNGGKLITTQTLPYDAQGDVTSVRVRVRITGDIHTLVGTLYGLESGRPLLIIDGLTIRGRVRRLPRRAGLVVAQAEAQETELSINFDVSGFVRGPGK
jgi:general secretion pathway protein M